MNRSFVGRINAVQTSAAVLALCLLTAYVYLGSQPAAAGLVRDPYDKIAHCALFAMLTALLSLAGACRYSWCVLATVTALALGDEWRQSYLPGRHADLLDIAADLVGAISTLLILQVLRRYAKQFQLFFNKE